MEEIKSTLPNYSDILSWDLERLIFVINQGNKCNWDIKLWHETQEEIDDYVQSLYSILEIKKSKHNFVEKHKQIIQVGKPVFCIKDMYSEQYHEPIYKIGKQYQINEPGHVIDEFGYNNEFRNIDCFFQHFNL